jgi:putative oxidoreductase
MNAAILLARLIVGLGIAAHGSQKLFGWFGGGGLAGTGTFMESHGYRPGAAYAFLAGAGELAGGLLIALGLLNGVGPGLVICVMLVAIFTVHFENGYFNAQGGWELPATNIAAALAFDYAGYGTYSLDRLLSFPFFTMAVRWEIVGGAVVLALLSFATRRRAPTQQPTA